MVDVTISYLEPFTNYSCTAKVFNLAGWTNDSDQDSSSVFLTKEGTPEISNITKVFLNSSYLKVTWDPPKRPNGLLIGYQLTYNYALTGCDINKTVYINQTENKFDILDPVPYAKYVFEIAAINTHFIGERNVAIFETAPARPSSPRTISIEKQTNPLLDGYNVTIHLVWTLRECSLNGKLELFHLAFNGSRIGYEDYSFNRTINFDSQVLHFVYIEHAVRPEYMYNVKIYTKVENVIEFSDPTEVSFKSLAGGLEKFLQYIYNF